MSLSQFQVLSDLGVGSYSTVFKVRRILDNEIYAMKKVSLEKLSEKEKKFTLSEIRILASINHPNIISFKEAFFEESENCLCLILEYSDSGDLYQRIQKCIKRRVHLSEKLVWSILIQLTQGLKALHDLNIIHRDLKSANVFLNKDGKVKLGDMNVSKVAKEHLTMRVLKYGITLNIVIRAIFGHLVALYMKHYVLSLHLGEWTWTSCIIMY
jgi:NIMA (never in mitosis gene a)-related kinase